MFKLPSFDDEVQGQGTSQTFTKNQEVNLHDPENIYFIAKGFIDLFIEIEHPMGRKRIFIATFQKGQLLFGFPPQDFNMGQLKGYVTKGCELVSIERSQLKISNPENWAFYLNYWMGIFSDLLSFRTQEKIEAHLKPDLKGQIPPQIPFIVEQEITWFKIESGSLALFGDTHLILKSPLAEFPLGKKMWAYSLEPIPFTTRTTLAVFQEGDPFKGLDIFHALILRQLVSVVQQDQEIDFRKFEKKLHFERGILTTCLSKMMMSLDENVEIAEGKEVDLVFKACQIVARNMGTSFKIPDQEDIPEDPVRYIQLICRFSHIHGRQIRLETHWYKQGFLPMVAFLDTPKHPVALISKKPGKYEMRDPATGAIEKVDEVLAKRLLPMAYSFYIPFPEGKLTFLKMIRFVGRGGFKMFRIVILTGILASLVGVVPSFASNYLFSTIIPSRNVPLLLQLIAGLILASFASGAFSLTRLFALTRLVGSMDNILQSALWDRLLKLPLKFYRQYTSGDLVRRVEAITMIRQMITSTVLTVLLSSIFSFVYLFVMIYWSWQLSLISIIPIGMMVCLLLVSLFFDIKLIRKMTNLEGKVNGIIVQLILGIGKLRIAGSEKRGFSWWADTFKDYTKYTKISQTVGNVVGVTGGAFNLLTSMIFYAAVMFWILPSQMKSNTGDFTLPRYIAFMSAFGSFSGAFIGLFDTLMGLVRVIPLWERARPIIKAEPEIYSSKLKPGKITGEIRAEDVQFRYDETSPMVLKGIHFSVKPGEMVGLVGLSGCGKSTFVRILLGLITPTGGNIYYNGKDINTLDLLELRRQMGTVMQDAAILQGSIYENIVCSGIYSPDDIERAIELSGFSEDLKNLPMGLHTLIPPGGAGFSGGQRQRLLIARALVGRPKVLIFDEATSALDNETQDKVSRNLEKLNVTRIVVAHRLSTIRNADRIYVFDKGVITQEGTFDELSKEEGFFKVFLERQRA